MSNHEQFQVNPEATRIDSLERKFVIRGLLAVGSLALGADSLADGIREPGTSLTEIGIRGALSAAMVAFSYRKGMQALETYSEIAVEKYKESQRGSS